MLFINKTKRDKKICNLFNHLILKKKKRKVKYKKVLKTSVYLFCKLKLR